MAFAGRVVLTLLLVTFAHRTVLAQSLEVTGHVSDHTGGVLPGVSVQLASEGSNEIVEAVTDALGGTRFKPTDQAGTGFAFPCSTSHTSRNRSPSTPAGRRSSMSC